MDWEFEPVFGPSDSVTEGPAWDGHALYFTRIQENLVMRYDPTTGDCVEFARDTKNTNGLAIGPNGTLYVETAHQTYARSSYGRNGYVSAIDPKKRKLLWRSPALVANADNFVLLNDTIVSGYGFTAEPDYLYAIDRATGRVKGRLLVSSSPQTIAGHGNLLTVVTYDHRLVVKVRGA